MTMLELLEHDKEKLIARLEEAKTPEKASAIISDEMDNLLVRYNKKCDLPVIRDAAAYMLQTVHLSAPLVNSTGEIQVWEKQTTSIPDSNATASKMPLRSLLFLTGSGVCALSSLFIAALANPASYRFTDLLLALILGTASPVLAWMSGRVKGQTEPLSSGSHSGNNHGQKVSPTIPSSRYETRSTVDAQKIYVTLHNIIFAIDQNIQYVEASGPVSPIPAGQNHSQASSLALLKSSRDQDFELSASASGIGSGDCSSGLSASPSGNVSGNASGNYNYSPFSSPFSDKELALFASLLEAGCSNDGSFALDQISDVRYFLHQNGIEAVDYDGKNRDLFDVMPSPKMQTLRPALVFNGNLLKKGMAAGEF